MTGVFSTCHQIEGNPKIVKRFRIIVTNSLLTHFRPQDPRRLKIIWFAVLGQEGQNSGPKQPDYRYVLLLLLL